MYSGLLCFQGVSSDLTERETDLLTDLEHVIATATNLPVDSDGSWTEESQLFALDREWHNDPSVWLRQMAIVIGEASECALACTRWWNKCQRLLALEGIGAGEYMGVRITFEAVLKDYIVACARVSYLMERWSQTGYYSVDRCMDDPSARGYSLSMPEPSYSASEATNSGVSLLLSRFGTAWSRKNIRVSRHLSSLMTGSAQIRKSVSTLRSLGNGANRPSVATRAWIEVFRLYCYASEIGPASIVLLDEFGRLFLRRPGKRTTG